VAESVDGTFIGEAAAAAEAVAVAIQRGR